MRRVGFMFPGMMAAKSTLDAGFNLGGLFHICGILTNVGRVEDNECYHFYAANMVPSVCNLIHAMDRERRAIAKAYNIELDDVLIWLKKTYGLKHDNLVDGLQEMAVTHYEHAPAPKSLTHRYLVQDVGCDLVASIGLARAARVATPVSDAIITLADALTGRDFFEEGRNLRRLGLDGKSPDEIMRALND